MILYTNLFPDFLSVLQWGIAIIVMVFLVFRYKILAFLIIFTYPVRNISLLEVPGAHLRPGDILILLGLITVFLQIRAGNWKVAFRKLNFLLLLFVLFCFVSLLWAPDTGYSFARASKTLRNFILFMELFLWLRLDYQSTYRYIVAGMVFSFTYILYVLLSAIFNQDINLAALLATKDYSSNGLNLWRSASASQATFSGSINSLALWTGMALILWISTGLWKDENSIKRWMFWGVTGVLFLLELATLSRSVSLGLLVAGCWFILMMKKMTRITPKFLSAVAIIGMASVFVLQALGFLQVLTGRFLSILSLSSDAAINERFSLWSYAYEVIKKQPLLGIGIGLGGENKFVAVHNLYLQILAELGLIGFSLFVCILGLVIGILYYYIKHNSSKRSPVLPIALMASVILYLITGLTMADFTESEIWIVFALVAALPYIQLQADRICIRYPMPGQS